MSARPSDHEEFTRLVSRLLDGQLSAAERAQFEVQIETDPDARRLYMQMIDQEVELECIVVPDDRPGILKLTESLERPGGINAARPRAWRIAAVAAILAFLLMIWAVRQPWQPAIPAQPGAGTAAPNRALVEAAPFAQGFWEEDFESGAAPRWTGEIVSAGLPAGSRHAIRAERRLQPDGVHYQIVPPADWNRGLFGLTAKSTLHLTYRLARPVWLTVFIHTNPADAEPGRFAMFQLSGSQFPGAAGQWQTASIPFSLFARKAVDPATGRLEFNGGPPQPGERVTALAFTAPHELDLIIDRIWVTPDGDGTETIQPLR